MLTASRMALVSILCMNGPSSNAHAPHGSQINLRPLYDLDGEPLNDTLLPANMSANPRESNFVMLAFQFIDELSEDPVELEECT